MASSGSIKDAQRKLCERFGVECVESAEDLKIGIARNVHDSAQPINGLRHPPAGDTTGWYIWAGENPSQEPDFFLPLHVSHLEECCPQVLKYLGLPPGWRFLVAPGHEDVWEDPSLLRV